MKPLRKCEQPLPILHVRTGEQRRDTGQCLRVTGSPPSRRTKVPTRNKAKEALLGGSRKADRDGAAGGAFAGRSPLLCGDKVSHDAPVPLDRDPLQGCAVEQLAEAVFQLGGGDRFHSRIICRFEHNGILRGAFLLYRHVRHPIYLGFRRSGLRR